jgi:DNA-binding NarL/FixJ family response regulator
MVSIVLAEEVELTRLGIKSTLGQEDDLDVVTECEIGSEVLSALHSAPADVLILGLSLDVVSTFEVLSELQMMESAVATIVLSAEEEPSVARRAFNLGAAGFALKSSPIKLLPLAIRTVAAGGVWLDAAFRNSLLADVDAGARAAAQPVQVREAGLLSAREAEILTLVAGGKTNTQVANKLGIGPETVKTHMRNIMQKLEVKDRTEAALKGLRMGVIAV